MFLNAVLTRSVKKKFGRFRDLGGYKRTFALDFDNHVLTTTQLQMSKTRSLDKVDLKSEIYQTGRGTDLDKQIRPQIWHRHKDRPYHNFRNCIDTDQTRDLEFTESGPKALFDLFFDNSDHKSGNLLEK